MNTNKDYYFQAMRAFAIIAVVLIHSFEFKIKDASSNITLEIIIRQFINYAVPMFLFISGYFVNKVAVDEGGFLFAIKKFKRLLIPYFFWSAIGIILLGNFGIKHIIFTLLTGQAMMQLYFIIVLFQLVILTPLMVKALENKTLTIVMFLITPTFLVCSYVYYLMNQNFVFFPYRALLFVTWFIFYFFGIFYRNNDKIKNLVKKSTLFILMGYILSLFLSIYEGLLVYNLNTNYLGFSISQSKISSFLATFFLICLLLSIKEKIKFSPKNPIIYIGNNSFGIYFIHIVIMEMLSRVGLFSNITNPMLFIPVYSTVTISFSLLCIFIVKKIIGKKISEVYLGF